MSGLQLPACQKCKQRKVRCDRQAPKCTNCMKGSVACIIVDPETGEQYSRDYIARLEQEEKDLNERVERYRTGTSVPNAHSTPSVPSDEVQRSRNYVGDGSGLGFLNNILSDARWQRHRTHIMNELAARPRMHRQHLTPNPLPPPQEAEQLIHNYFARFHIHHTFLLCRQVLEIYNRIYSEIGTDDPPSAQDRFRLLMIFAISATTRHRAGLSSENPYGYFMAAKTQLESIPLIGSVAAIENLLLIARFGMYHHIGTSMWEISQFCIRQCIEWRLHVRDHKLFDLLTEQHHRRIFWECYILDRYSSGILGRPFAISESDISVPLPIDVDDEALATSSASSLELVPPNTSNRPTELSVFIHCIRLRQISSRIHTQFYTSRGSKPLFSSVGHVFTCFTRFRAELDLWRSTAPVFRHPRSLYERPEWHDFLHVKDLMLLARGAIQNLSSRCVSSAIMTDVVLPCYDSASRVIELYVALMDKGAITWTRSYFQVIFTAGLTVIYCVSLELEMSLEADRDPLRILDLCYNTLNFFKEKMPDAGSFAVVFGLLRDEFIRLRANAGLVHDLNLIGHTGSISNSSSEAMVNGPNASLEGIYSSGQPFDAGPTDFSFGLTGNLDIMTQLEAGLHEYAWGSFPWDDSLSSERYTY